MRDSSWGAVRGLGRWLGAALGLGVVLSAGPASAQQKTFVLDRLNFAGAPDDAIPLWRPVMSQRTRFFGQMALGITLNPLKIKTIAPNSYQAQKVGNTVKSQVIDYAVVGMELMNRMSFLASIPTTLFENGDEPLTAGAGRGVNLSALAAGDLKLESRFVVYRSDANDLHLGIGGALYVPTGDQYSFAGEGGSHAVAYAALEVDVRQQLLVVFNSGVHFRPPGSLGQLGVGNEWIFGGGAFLPLRDGRVRVGAELFGSTGLGDVQTQTNGTQKSFFTGKNTPVEWMGEGRFALDKARSAWAGVGVGTRIDVGYGAPDLRVIGTIGYAYGIEDSDAPSPDARMKFIKERLARQTGDADHDGIPDDVDLCPSVPEDRQEPDPTDGCPKPPDRDGDGIPDEFDKCPDAAEDKDGIADNDGCPEEDFDRDGVADAQDACPREPGQPSPDPKQNGCPQFIKRVQGATEIQILKQVQFDTGRATIKPVSFPILDEVVKLLVANPDIKHMSIDGHTDNRGSTEMNNKLSADRANSVMEYLVGHGIKGERLEAHGYGPSRPVESNATEKGRQTNRRVEFKITQQANASPPPQAAKP